MSKSLGNVVDPFQLLQQHDHQTDILRLWVAKGSLGANYPISEAEFEQVAAFYKNLKNKLRFITGNLFDLRESKFSKHFNEFSLLDRAWLHQIFVLVRDADSEKFPAFQYNDLLSEVEQFLERFSNHYITSAKDQLYCDQAQSEARLRRQLVFSAAYRAIQYLLAPITPNLMEQIHHLVGKSSNSYFELKPNIATELAAFEQEPINQAYWRLIEMKQELVTLIQKLKVPGPKTNPLARVHLQINLSQHVNDILKSFLVSEEAKYILRCASVNVSETALKHALSQGILVDFQVADQQEQCPRCRLYSKSKDSLLCSRCQNAIQ
ncbi:Isoleucine--tRNA ligase, mitochondrial [Cichlidogyrus casuarinus]|uniref:Isoleucine--tRNA ligase, mitochondrial n=1 Tax=Cichlidogyrus casuarinus TaxID=1844966 RepID=A0ABD2Q798_9PLAT